jgi:uncharacterized protein YoxC
MTIDERLEKLTERHEALAQTMELTALENKERDARLDKLAEDLSKLVATVDRVVGSVEKLTQIVTDHQERIRNLEGR